MEWKLQNCKLFQFPSFFKSAERLYIRKVSFVHQLLENSKLTKNLSDFSKLFCSLIFGDHNFSDRVHQFQDRDSFTRRRETFATVQD